MNLSHLTDDKLDVMNFLNEVAMQYPNAISFASGRPKEEFFDIDEWHSQLATFAQYLCKTKNISISAANNVIGQYGRTAGLINELVAKQLHNDEQICCQPEELLITNGCQEAMTILLMAACAGGFSDKVLLVSEPTYIGITGLAKILGVSLLSISDKEQTVSLPKLTEAVNQVRAENKEIAGLYLIPDFDNPSGDSLDVNIRKQVIDYCFEQHFPIFEDDPYGLFYFTTDKKPTMYQLDDKGVVYHLGSFSKTMCPTLRIGYILAPRQDYNELPGIEIIQQLTKIKSFVSVNTSQLTQAVAGGILLQNDCSLKDKISSSLHFYRNNRDVIVAALESSFRDMPSVSWNAPEGGFFITVKLPFDFDNRALQKCAQQYHFLCMPRHYFALCNEVTPYIRLAYSYIKPEQIKDGIDALKNFVIEHHATLIDASSPYREVS